MSGYIGNKPFSKVTGVFTPNQQYDLVLSNNWSEPDPFWNDVVLLLQPFTGATSIEDLSQSAHSITNNGVTLDSSNEKWTGAPSMLFERSNSDNLEISDDPDFDQDNYDFTIEFFAYSVTYDAGGNYAFLSIRTSGGADNFYVWNINNDGNNGARFDLENGGTKVIDISEGSDYTTTGQWDHFAFAREGDTFRMFRNGSLIASGTSSGEAPDVGAPVLIGENNGFGENFDGNMTSLRITKGVARYTSNFTPPTRPFPTR